MKNLKLYVWEDVLCDYTCGVIFALAETLDEAKELVNEESEYNLDWEMEKEPKIIENKFAFSLWGGG